MKLKNLIYSSIIIIISVLLSIQFYNLRYPKMQYSDEKVFDDKWTGKDFNEARNRARLFYKTIRLKEIVEYFNYMPYEDRYDQLLYDGYTRDDVLVLRTNFNFEGYERYVLLYKLVDGRWAVMAEGGL